MRRISIFLLSVLAAVAAACGGDSTGPGNVIPEELVGTWVAEPACLSAGCGFTIYLAANPADSLNFTKTLGTTTRLTIAASGDFRIDVSAASDTSLVGKARVDGSTLIITDPSSGTTDTLDWSIENQLLHITFRSEFLVDLDGDQVSEHVRARGFFKHQ